MSIHLRSSILKTVDSDQPASEESLITGSTVFDLVCGYVGIFEQID